MWHISHGGWHWRSQDICSQEAEREIDADVHVPFFFLLNWVIRTGLPTSTDRYSQKLLSQVIPNPVKSTVNINYHSDLHSNPVDHSSNCYDLDATVRCGSESDVVSSISERETRKKEAKQASAHPLQHCPKSWHPLRVLSKKVERKKHSQVHTDQMKVKE